MGRTRKKTVPEPVIETANVPEASVIRAISVDLGNAYSNLRADGNIEDNWRSVQGIISDSNRLKGLPFDDVIRLDDSWYVFGKAAYTYAPRTLEDWPATNRYESAWYKRLFAYSLHKAYGVRLNEGPFYPIVALSIPAGLFKNELVVDRIKERLIGPYVIGNTLDQVLQLEILPDNLKVIPEGAGSFISAAAVEGNKSPLNHGLWYVVDVGYLTTDIVGFQDGDYMPDLSASDPAAGMESVADAVARYIAGETGVHLTAKDVDPDLSGQCIIVSGQAVDVQAAKSQALEALGKRIARFAWRTAAGQNLSGLLLTGGGAEVVRDYVKAQGLPDVRVAPNARRANVEGGFILVS